jgi:hypothetical protein
LQKDPDKGRKPAREPCKAKRSQQELEPSSVLLSARTNASLMIVKHPKDLKPVQQHRGKATWHVDQQHSAHSNHKQYTPTAFHPWTLSQSYGLDKAPGSSGCRGFSTARSKNLKWLF